MIPTKSYCLCCGRVFWDAEEIDFCPRCYDAGCEPHNGSPFEDPDCLANLKEKPAGDDTQ